MLYVYFVYSMSFVVACIYVFQNKKKKKKKYLNFVLIYASQNVSLCADKNITCLQGHYSKDRT